MEPTHFVRNRSIQRSATNESNPTAPLVIEKRTFAQPETNSKASLIAFVEITSPTKSNMPASQSASPTYDLSVEPVRNNYMSPRTAKKSEKQHEGPASSGATGVVKTRLDQDYDIDVDLADHSNNVITWLRKPKKAKKPNFFLRILHKFILDHNVRYVSFNR